MAFLVEVGVEPARRVALADVTTLGRDEGSTVRVDDPLVAKQHAEIRRTPEGRYELVDLGSRRGTYVRDRRVATRLLEHGDEMLIGPVRLRFEHPPLACGDDARVKVRRAATDHELRRDYEHLRAALELINALEGANDIAALLEAVLRTAIDLVHADRGAILLMAENEAHPSIELARTREGQPVELRLSASLMSEVVSSRAAVLTANVIDDPRLNGAASLVAQRVRSAMCIPLFHLDEQIGVLHLDSRVGDAFSQADLDLVATVARQASSAIRNALLTRKVTELANSERQRLHRVLAALPDGVLLVEQDGRVAFANGRASELLGDAQTLSAGGVLESIGDFTIGELVSEGEPVEIVVGQHPRSVLLVSAHETTGGSAGEVLIRVRDVTYDRDREARAAQQERLAAMGQLTAGITHDFNNLLAVISNFAQFVLDDVTEQRQREDLEQVLEATRRAAELVRHLLAFGRREMVRAQVVRLDRVIAGVDRLLRRAIGEHVELHIRAEPNPCRVKVDPAMLGHVVLNLAVNARDAMPRGGTLTITASRRELGESDARREGLRAGQYGVVEVTDTGIGMPEHVASRVFEPFFTTKGPEKGTGLGLASAYGIVRQAGGAITLRTREGEGTTFTVLLPATSETDAEVVGPRPRPHGGRETILVAEDERAVRDFTRRILADAGYRVLHAGSGQEAIHLAVRHEGAIDLLLADMVMPRMSGKQLAQELSAQRPGIRTLYMSGYFDEAVAGDVNENFLAKPFLRDELLERVRLALTPPSLRA